MAKQAVPTTVLITDEFQKSIVYILACALCIAVGYKSEMVF